MKRLPRPAEVSKALGALTAGVLVLVGAGVLTGSPATVLTAGLTAAAAVVGVYVAPSNAARSTVNDPLTRRRRPRP